MTNDPNPNVTAEENHYVLIIHGTWGGPAPQGARWWQSQHDFCTTLSRLLSAGPLKNAVWRSFRPGSEFHWSGNNSRAERIRAGKELASTLKQIIEKDTQARIHLIAHSHGGNVLLAALNELIEEDRILEDYRLGRIVFLGTPFFRKIWKHSWVNKATPLALTLAAFIAFALLSGVMFGSHYTGMSVTTVSMIVFGGVALAWLVSILALTGFLYIFYTLSKVKGSPTREVIKSEPDLRVDTNLYFDGGRHDWSLKWLKPLSALVISAGLLDEAFLILSSHPVWSAYLKAMIKHARPQAPGRFGDDRFGWRRLNLRLHTVFLETELRRAIWLLRWAHFPISWVGWYVVEQFLRLGLPRFLKAIAYGEPNEELADAVLRVEPRPNIPRLLNDTYWDVGQIICLQQSRRVITRADHGSESFERYGFLKDPETFRKRLNSSRIWEVVHQHLRKAEGAVPIEDLALYSLLLEERTNEVLGEIDLNHSLYYGSEVVMKGITQFLESGKLSVTQ